MEHNNFRNHLYILGPSTKVELMSFVLTECIKEEQLHLEQTLFEWKAANMLHCQTELAESGDPEKINIKDMPEGSLPEIKAVEGDAIFKNTFSLLPYEIKLVEIDRLIPCQRHINVDYVEYLKKKLPEKPTISDLIKICLSPRKESKQPLEQQLGPNVYSYSSENLDLRVIGSFAKDINPEEVDDYAIGGLPLTSLVILVGFGANTMYAFSVNGRLLLSNGIHRAYALRSMGITHIPLVIQKVTKPYIELPDVLIDLPKEHLLKTIRPGMMKDFFNNSITKTLHVKPQNAIVQLQWNNQRFKLPFVT